MIHEDLPLVNFTLTPEIVKSTETKKAPLFEKCFFVTATGFKPVTG